MDKMEPHTQEESDRIEPEIQDERTEATNIDDGEVEELHNSLKEVVQDPAVKPKFQCLMVDPSFSMVTVQSEDSGIVWETASSRCSTPWASEASSPSDSYSLEGSGTQGNIVIIMDEEKVKRKKKTSSRGKFGDRFRRPGSRLSGPAIGEERPAMIEVSVPNIRCEDSEDGQPAEEKPNKDQELFNLISEGFEILNIVVPSKLPTVDEECSTELTDNLSYLEATPKIKAKCKYESQAPTAIPKVTDVDIQEIKDDSQEGLSQTPANEQLKKDETDMDYLEKFTLQDQHAPDDESEKPEPTQDIQEPQVPEEQKVEDTVDENSFVIVSEVEIAEDHVDEVFYGASCNAEPQLPSHRKEDEEHASGSFKTLKECGSTLFGSQETILTPIFLPPGPPKIIDQDLLDEPRAMSFHYLDLYEDAVGDRKKDDDASDIESVVSEKSFKRRFSDSDDGDGYLEKFILKDDTSVVEDVQEVDTPSSDRVIWPQNKFEMTGCLIRVKQDDAPKEEDAGVSQAELESKHVIKDERQPSYSSKDCEDCAGLKTSCMTVKSVSETFQGCDDFDMKTGCAIQKGVSSDKLPFKAANQESGKSILIEDGKQIEVQELKDMDKQISGGLVEEKMTGLNDKLKILPQQPTQNDDDEVTELQETVIITKEEALDKGQQVTDTTQEIGKPNLVNDIDVKATSATTTAEEIRPLYQEEVISQIKCCEPCKDMTKRSGEKMTIVEPENQVKISKAVLESKSEVLESREIPAVVVEDLRDSAVRSIFPESGEQEQVTDAAMVPDVEGHVTSEAVDSDLKTISDQKVLEELPVREADTTEERVEEIKVKAIEKTKEQTEKDTVPVFDRKTSATDSVTTEKRETIDSASAVESSSNVAKSVFIPEKKEGVLREIKKYSKIPTGYDQILEISGETKEAESDLVTMTQEIPVACPSAPEITESDLAAAALNEEVGREENRELPDAHVLNDSHAEIAMISLIPATKTDDSSKVTVPSPVTKEESSEIRDVAIDRSNLETTGEALQLVDGVSKVSVQELEGRNESKSKKILLKDTHKEELWRTLEPASPSPPVEIQDSTMRVSPLEEVGYMKENDNFAMDQKIKRDKGTLRSFSPLEDLSGFGRDSAELDLQKELYEELDYEMVTKQDARESETEVTVGKEEYQERGQDQSPAPAIVADYEFIEDLDGGQISQLRLLKEKGEIQPMDAFCLVCRCPILMSDGGHENHEVSTLEKAFEDIKNQLSNWISVLQERSENIEDMVSELELAYNTVEEQCKDSEKALDEQNEKMMTLVMERYNEMSQTMEEEKKAKLEQLYDQIVSFQENSDSAKETMEMATKEMEETNELAFLSSYKDIDMRLKTALDLVMSLELGPQGLLVFEDYAKGTTGNEKKNRQVIPVPQQPHLQPQEANSATSTSVTVYWTVNEGDIIDCFQVYCMEEPQGAISEEYRVTVKESHCNLEELEPDKCYKVWVMAVNYTGCSMPSERLPFRTAPSVPVINPEGCTVLWDSATIRWSSSQPSAAESFTLEYCRQYALEGEGLRSVSGIKGCEHKVLLQPNENFLFYIKSVNSAGASDQSEAALVSTRGTRFHLLSETANMALKVSEDQNSVQYPVETYNKMFTLIECPAVRGELLPRVGYHYWETVVAGCKAYRIGVAYQTEPQDSTVGESSASWCLHCVPTSISCRFELLHDSVESDIFVTDVPARIGTLLDFTQGRLVFFNAQNGQCLGSFQQAFSQPCYPVFTLERPGNLELKMTTEVPEFAKHW
ncbi:cardiomyopathy-associated protein 5 [Neoarius graeffei]|uniref:cardiomyopathy-associated protein 5 n=1 Tax=Neoarius graeffei TaxID=443677 RepID=UPI00298C111A|nr:cardiomyopathy-associated protein 5 [Neoarius graeffei]